MVVVVWVLSVIISVIHVLLCGFQAHGVATRIPCYPMVLVLPQGDLESPSCSQHEALGLQRGRSGGREESMKAWDIAGR